MRNTAAWDAVEQDLLARIGKIEHGIPTKEQRKLLDRIKAAQWLLLTNDLDAVCRRCNAVHPYVTLGCIERPFNRLEEVYLFEERQAQERGLVRGENVILTEQVYRGMRVGRPVPITRKESQKLMLRIRAKLGRGAI